MILLNLGSLGLILLNLVNLVHLSYRWASSCWSKKIASSITYTCVCRHRVFTVMLHKMSWSVFYIRANKLGPKRTQNFVRVVTPYKNYLSAHITVQYNATQHNTVKYKNNSDGHCRRTLNCWCIVLIIVKY